MKNFCKAFLTLCAVLAALALTGCPGVFNPPESGNAGVLTVTINGAGGARQILPTDDPVFVGYELSFADFDTDEPVSATIVPVWGDDDEANVAIITGLPVGKYKVTAKGLVQTSDGPAVAAVGEGIVEIETLLDEKSLDIKISALITGEDDGTFSYDVTIPDWVTSGTLTIELADGTGTAIVKDLLEDPTDTISLAPGYYLLTVELANADGRSADYVDIVYIYQNIETPWEFEFEDGDFAYPLPGAAINGSPVSVSGTVANSVDDGAEDADVEVTITLSHATVASALSGDVSDWFSVTVKGLTYTAAAEEGDDEIIITIEGEPEEISSATDVTITIPIGAIKDVTGTANAAALTVTGHVAYDITAALEPPPVIVPGTAIDFTNTGLALTAVGGGSFSVVDANSYTFNAGQTNFVKFKVDLGSDKLSDYDFITFNITSTTNYKTIDLIGGASLVAADITDPVTSSPKSVTTFNSTNNIGQTVASDLPLPFSIVKNTHTDELTGVIELAIVANYGDNYTVSDFKLSKSLKVTFSDVSELTGWNVADLALVGNNGYTFKRTKADAGSVVVKFSVDFDSGSIADYSKVTFTIVSGSEGAGTTTYKYIQLAAASEIPDDTVIAAGNALIVNTSVSSANYTTGTLDLTLNLDSTKTAALETENELEIALVTTDYCPADVIWTITNIQFVP